MANFANTTLYSPTHPILLRNPAPSDAEAISQILSAPSNTKFDPMCSPTGITVPQASRFITRSLESASQAVPNSLNLVLVLLPSIKSREPGTVIGIGGFGGIDVVDEKRFGDVGIMINEGYRGKGFAVESLRLSIDSAVGTEEGELGLDGVTATMLEANEAMVGVLEKKMGWVGECRESKFGFEKHFKLSPGEWVELKGKLGWK